MLCDCVSESRWYKSISKYVLLPEFVHSTVSVRGAMAVGSFSGETAVVRASTLWNWNASSAIMVNMMKMVAMPLYFRMVERVQRIKHKSNKSNNYAHHPPAIPSRVWDAYDSRKPISSTIYTLSGTTAAALAVHYVPH